MTTITIELDTREVTDAISALVARMRDPRPLMQDIGEVMVQSTKNRFGAGIGPDGAAWEPNTALTLSRKKGTKPLIGESHRLGNEITYALDGDGAGVSIGSNLIYAATQQFGADQGAFGRSKRGGPIPWGNIPARPFLGLADDDATAVLDIVQEHLESLITGRSR